MIMDKYNNIYLREQREAHLMTQEQVAKELGMTRSNYTKIELGHYDYLSIKHIKKLHNLLDLDINTFLNITDKDNNKQ